MAVASGPALTGELKEALRTALAEITAAIARQDLGAAVAAMKVANDACAELSGRGVLLDEAERPAFESLAASCGVALDRAGRDLQTTSNQRENVRRGMNAYLRGEE